MDSLIQEERSPTGNGKTEPVSSREAVPEEQPSRPRKKGYFNKGKNWVSLGTMIFVAIYTVITYCLFVSTTDHNDKQLRKLEDSNRINREAFTSVQRAFLFFDRIEAKQIPGANVEPVRWVFSPVWVNGGNTPTKDLTIRFDCRQSDHSVIDDIGEQPELSKGDNPSFLGPRANAEIGNCRVRADFLREVRDGMKFLYLLGRADYFDVFEGSPLHVTEF